MKQFRTFAAAAAGLVLFAHTADAQALKYTYPAQISPVYEVVIRTELPDETKTITGYLKYHLASTDTATGQTTLACEWDVGQAISQRGGTTFSNGGGIPAFVSSNEPAGPGAPKAIVDALGNLVSESDAGRAAQLDYTLGTPWQILIQPLPPANQTTWTTHRLVTVWQETTENGGGPFGQRTVVRVETRAQESVTYALGPVADGVQTIQRTYDLVSDKKVGDAPSERLNGTGQYGFDTRAGVIKNLEFKLTYTATRTNVTVRIPITVTAHLLTPDELAKRRAESEAAAARQKADEQQRAKERRVSGADVSDLPDGMTRTAVVGGNGGGDFMKIDDEHRPVIGFKVRIGQWDNHNVLGNFDPLYEKPDDMRPKDRTIVLAKDGYAVGGIWVNGSKYAYAVRVIFMKKTATGVDPKQQYVSPWYGTLYGPERIKLGATGAFVYGTCGLQGLNTNGIGLIIGKGEPAAAGAPGTPADPTDDPNFKGTPAPGSN